MEGSLQVWLACLHEGGTTVILNEAEKGKTPALLRNEQSGLTNNAETGVATLFPNGMLGGIGEIYPCDLPDS